MNISEANEQHKFYKNSVILIYFIIVFNCIYKALITFLHFPDFIVYASDFAWVFLGILLIPREKRSDYINNTNIAVLIIGLLFCETLIGYVINLYNPLIYLWGVRTFFRYFVFFMACICFLNKKNVLGILDFLYYILIVNVAFSAFEHMMGYDLDSVTGLYTEGKTIIGGSAGLNVLMCIVCTYSLLQYFHNNWSLGKAAIPLIASVYMAAVGELKGFYVELALIIIFSVILTKLTVKKVLGTIGGLFGLFWGVRIYEYFYGHMNSGFFTTQQILDYAGSNGASYGQHALNRLTALPYMWDNFLIGTVKKIFGLGLGYADTVSFKAFSSQFQETNANLGYQFFFSSLEITNIGALGLLLYVLFLIAVFIYANRMKKNAEPDVIPCYVLTQIICLICVFLMVYNQSLIIDNAAYNIFLVLALPYALERSKKHHNAA